LKGIHLHLALSAIFGLTANLAIEKFNDYRIQKELVIWDYVKQHQEDFPEVFNGKLTLKRCYLF
jgi:hypothetical protein